MWLIVLIGAMVTQTMALYGCLSNLISKQGDDPRIIGLGMGASLGFLSTYSWCSQAQKVEENVSMIYIYIFTTAPCENVRRPIGPVLQVN
jgi:hypothetical protein